MASLYIHVPFCRSKCEYCSFLSYPRLEHLYGRYVRALKKEVGDTAKIWRGGPLSTVFFGGGTPTVLPGTAIKAILDHIRRTIGIEDDAEISIEANPGTIDYGDLQEIYRAGVNRLSFGVQSFDGNELKALGRTHSPEDAKQAILSARAVGFDNLSLDLMYGLPGQKWQGWQKNLQTALSLSPKHLSLYQLTIEEKTPFYEKSVSGELVLPTEDEILKMDELNITLCTQAGLIQYEISNFAVAGYRCRHNINYWRNNEYLAVGAGAVSYNRGRRQRRVADPVIYCDYQENEKSVVEETEILTHDESFRESVIMGLRMTEGVSQGHLFERYGVDVRSYYGDVLDKLLRLALVEFTDTHFRITAKGRLLSNSIMAELV